MSEPSKKLPIALTVFKYGALVALSTYGYVWSKDFWDNKIMMVKQNTHSAKQITPDSTQQDVQTVQFTTTNPEPTPN